MNKKSEIVNKPFSEGKYFFIKFTFIKEKAERYVNIAQQNLIPACYEL